MLRVLIDAGAAQHEPPGMVHALGWALRSGSAEAARLILDQGADPNGRDEAGNTMLMAAAASGVPAVVREILLRHPDVNDRGPKGSTALMAAAGEWHPDPEPPPVDREQVVRLLLKAGADPNTQNDDGTTALMACAWNADAALTLIQAGANVNARSKTGRIALINVSKPAVLRVLLEHGADIAARDAEGKTALEVAKQYGMKEKAALLEAAEAAAQKQ